MVNHSKDKLKGLITFEKKSCFTEIFVFIPGDHCHIY